MGLSQRIRLYLAGAFVLMFGAFFNWYPFFTGDTAVYLASGFEGYVPSERPIFYGLFIRFSSLGFSLWLTAFAQSFILAYVLLKLIIKIWPLIRWWKAFNMIALVGICTGVWWESSKLIPDVFIAILVLSLLLLVFFELQRWERIVLYTLVWFSSIVHLSHAAVLLGFVALIVVFQPFGIKRGRMWMPGALALLALISLVLSNALDSGQWTVAKGQKVFLLGKLNEAGLLDTYLRDHCEQEDLALCAYQDSLPATAWQLVWDPHSPVMKLGGWEAQEEEHRQIVNGILSTPAYWPKLLFKATTNTLVQLSQTKVGDNLFRQEKQSNSVQAIKKYYLHEMNAALWTKQFLLELPFEGMSWFYLILMLAIACWYIQWAFVQGKLTDQQRNMLWTLLLLLILNAFFTANLANIAARLNARLLWLLPALMLIQLLGERTKGTGYQPQT